MSRSSLWSLLAVVVLIAFGLFFWSTGNQTPPPAPPAPAPAGAPATDASASATQPAAQAPAATQTSAAAPAAQAPAAAPQPAEATASATPPAAQAPALAPAPAAEATAAQPAAQPPAPATVATARSQSEPDEGKEAAEEEAKGNEKAKGELAALNPGFDAKALTAALNDSVVNFPSGSSEVPAKMDELLQNAAEDLKKLPAGHVLEIAGYTDNTGNAADNVSLSQARAEAVRNAFMKYGVNPDMLVAKGYGSADPIASNDTVEGRLKNRRIEYHVIKTP
jgi:outer membrane protein OmpA-like peptidoglycan-associated protein